MEEFLQSLNIETLWFWRGLWIFVVWVLAIILVRYVGRVMGRLIKKAKHLEVAPRSLGMVDKILDILIIITAIVITLLILNLYQIVLGLLATAGITSVVLGIAARDLFSNVFGGLTLIFERPFVIGDKIEVTLGYKQQYIGKVYKMSMTTTQIATEDGPIVSIPNGELAKRPIINKTIHEFEPLAIKVAIANDNDVDTALKVLKEVFTAEGRLLPSQTPKFFVKDIREYAVDIIAKAKVNKDDKDEVISDLMKRVITEFRANEVELAVPISKTIAQEQVPSPGVVE